MKNLIVLTGPTAVGKSKLAVRLAANVNAEIISADSMQVYRGMDIGTDKIRPEDTRGIPHHLIDVLDATEPFNVRRFQEMALNAMEGIYARGRIPLLAGGTGFYIQAVLYGIDFTETDDDPGIRQRYEEAVRTHGEAARDALYEKLCLADPESAEAIDRHNVKRVIRALEYYEKTGKPISRHNAEQRMRSSPYRFRYFVVTDDRKVLYDRIDARVDSMIEYGLVDEVKRLRESGVKPDMTSMQGLGYREIYAFLEGRLELAQAIRLIKQNTRHFAKRQLTWFRREKDVTWVDKREFARDDARILAFLTDECRSFLP